ncbi:MAG TPA: hypothetical protein VF989_10500 [Polyangiaceae bacterium]
MVILLWTLVLLAPGGILLLPVLAANAAKAWRHKRALDGTTEVAPVSSRIELAALPSGSRDIDG